MAIKEAHLERRRRNYKSEDCVQDRRAMAVQSKGEERGRMLSVGVAATAVVVAGVGKVVG